MGEDGGSGADWSFSECGVVFVDLLVDEAREVVGVSTPCGGCWEVAIVVNFGIGRSLCLTVEISTALKPTKLNSTHFSVYHQLRRY